MDLSMNGMEQPPTVRKPEIKDKEKKGQWDKIAKDRQEAAKKQKEALDKFRTDIAKKIKEFVNTPTTNDPKTVKYELAPMGKFYRSMVREACEEYEDELVIHSFGIEEEDRHCVIWRKGYEPSDDEIRCLKMNSKLKGEEELTSSDSSGNGAQYYGDETVDVSDDSWSPNEPYTVDDTSVEPNRVVSSAKNYGSAQSKGNQEPIEETLDVMMKELEVNRLAQRRAELKLQNIRQRHEYELTYIDDFDEGKLSRNCGIRDYLNRLSERKRVNDDLVKRYRQELENQKKENDELRLRCQSIEKQSQEYLKAWKDCQRSSRRNLIETNSYLDNHHRSIDRSSNQRPLLNRSPSLSLEDSHHIPPPMDEPQLDEILGNISTNDKQYNDMGIEGSHHSYRSIHLQLDDLDSLIPPPPEVQMDEIFKELNSS